MGNIDQIIDHEVDGRKSVTVVVGGTSVTEVYLPNWGETREGAIDKAYARANEIEKNK